MDTESEVIRQQMGETRCALSQKLEKLEQEVTGKVQGASATVTGTVHAVKQSVHETVESVKETFNVRHHVEKRPWTMMAGAAALGFLGGRLLRRDFGGSRPRLRVASLPPPTPGARPSWGETSQQTPFAGNGKPDRMAGLETFHEEIDKLKGLGVGALMGLVRDMVTKAVPEPLERQVKEVIDGITVKLGGQPIHGPLLRDTSEGEEAVKTSAYDRAGCEPDGGHQFCSRTSDPM